MTDDACACGWKLPAFESPSNGAIIMYRCGNCGANHVTTCGTAPKKKIGEELARRARANAIVKCEHPDALRVRTGTDPFAPHWCRPCGTFFYGPGVHQPTAIATLEALLEERAR